MIGQLSIPQMEEVLASNTLGRLGFHDGEKTYIIPINFAYDGHNIIAHSTEGSKIHIMRKNPGICFEVDEMKSFTNWKSVIVWGEFQELTDDEDRIAAMELFMEKMSHLKLSETALPHKMGNPATTRQSKHNPKAIVFRIAIQEKSGRFENE